MFYFIRDSLMLIKDMVAGSSGYVKANAVCGHYRLELITGFRQDWPDYQAVPRGQGTGYFLYPEAEVYPDEQVMP